MLRSSKLARFGRRAGRSWSIRERCVAVRTSTGEGRGNDAQTMADYTSEDIGADEMAARWAGMTAIDISASDQVDDLMAGFGGLGGGEAKRDDDAMVA